MPLIETRGARIDVEQTGQGPDLVLLHSLLTDRTVFDRIVPKVRRRLTLVNLPEPDTAGTRSPGWLIGS